jgi:hypothetical protein
MTKIHLKSYPISESSFGGGNPSVHITEDGPLATRTVECDGLKGIMAAFDAYTAEAVATGTPMAITIILGRGERSPNGFKKYQGNGLFYINSEKL